jgi:hypothetical protein
MTKRGVRKILKTVSEFGIDIPAVSFFANVSFFQRLSNKKAQHRVGLMKRTISLCGIKQLW